MPATPVTWLEDFAANLNITGTQVDPVITQLASGHILVVWTDNDSSSTVASPPSSDIIGRIFDSLGNPVTSEFILNTRNTADLEFNPTVTALANGGFVVAYDESGSFDDLNIETYSFDPSTGTVAHQSDAFLFLDSGTSNPIDPVVASASATSVLAAYHTVNADGSDDVIIRVYNPSTNTLGSEINIFTGNTGVGEDVEGPDVAALTNGNYVVTFANRNAGTDTVNFHIRDSAGGAITSGIVTSGAEFTDVQVAALAGGGFVVAYENTAGSGNIDFRVFDSAGTPLAGGGPVTAGFGSVGNNQNEPAVIGLADGTFVIAWDDDTADQIVGQRYSVVGANVVPVGAEFVVDNTGGGSITEIELQAFADGRFGVTWHDGADVRLKILDTRDLVNSPAVYTPVSQQIGTIGNDVFTADGLANQVFGHTGDDAITEAGTPKQYFGGDGNDTLLVTSAIDTDLHDGGAGIDTIDWSGSPIAGATFDLAAGTATAGGATETIAGFENLVGTNGNDIILGSSDANVLSGGGGDDTITGRTGNDTIAGGAGNDRNIWNNGDNTDTFDGGDGTDTQEVNGAAVGDTFTLGASGSVALFSRTNLVPFDVSMTNVEAIEVRGLDGDDSFIINNLAGTSLAAGNILFDGGNGNDTLNATASTTAITALGGAGNDTLIGSSVADSLSSGDGNDSLDGGAGADQMAGGLGDDTYVVDNAGDVVSEVASGGIDTVQSSISFTLSTDVENLTLTSAGAINGTGNALNNVMIGNDGSNVLSGDAGADTMSGGAGNDTLIGGLGKDILNGGAGADIFDFNAVAESGRKALRDVVTFARKEGDEIDLSDIDAAKGRGNRGDQDFEWVNENRLGARFTGEAGELRFKNGILSGDINGDGKADFEIQIIGRLKDADVIL